MTQDFEHVAGVTSAVIGKVGEEPVFLFPEVLEVIKLCSANQIAVLGFELFIIKPDGYYASGCSAYDLQISHEWSNVSAARWIEYVSANNDLAAESVRLNATGGDHVYILTTASWKEFCEIKIANRSNANAKNTSR